MTDEMPSLDAIRRLLAGEPPRKVLSDAPARPRDEQGRFTTMNDIIRQATGYGPANEDKPQPDADEGAGS